MPKQNQRPDRPSRTGPRKIDVRSGLQIAQRHEQASQDARKRRAACEQEQLLRRRERDF